MMRELQAVAVYLLLLLLRLTWRVRVRGRPPGAGVGTLMVFWHGDLLALLGLPLRYLRGITVMVSRSRDGDLAARVAQRLGLRCARGSTSAGAVPATLTLTRSLRAGGRVAIAGDGPRGPRGQLQAGATRLALLGRCRTIPLAASASCALTLGSWDALAIPAPFARVTIVWGEKHQCELASSLARTRAAAREATAR